MRRECWIRCAMKNSTNIFNRQLNINVYIIPNLSWRSVVTRAFRSARLTMIISRRELARHASAGNATANARKNEIKRPRGVDRKVERGPLSSRDGGVERWGRPESCKWYERGRERVRETARVKRGKTKGVVENCESRGSIVTPFAGVAKPGRFRRHHHCHYNHHLRQRDRRYTTALPLSSVAAAAVVVDGNPTRLPLVLLPSSGLSIESTDVVNYLLICRRRYFDILALKWTT